MCSQPQVVVKKKSIFSYEDVRRTLGVDNVHMTE